MRHALLITDAAAAWLQAKRTLTSATRASYTGEATRFVEFCASRRTHTVDRLSPTLWQEYLTTLRGGRVEVRSKRQEALNEGSARQAMRITRSLLTWLRDEALIEWKPTATTFGDPAGTPASTTARARSTRPPSRRSRQAARCVGLSVTLEKASTSNDEVSLRRELTANLIFWAALRTGELAALQALHMTRVARGLVRVDIPGRANPCYVPGHVWTLWTRYRVAREGRLVTSLPDDAALISSLQGSNALTPWSIWALIRDIDSDLAQTPRELRAAFLRLLTQDAARLLTTARSACGQPRLSPVALIEPPHETYSAIGAALSKAAAGL
jgi:site-specific recombinase XerD